MAENRVCCGFVSSAVRFRFDIGCGTVSVRYWLRYGFGSILAAVRFRFLIGYVKNSVNHTMTEIL
jgi:hypothetical protein